MATSIRLDPDTERRLDELASRTGRTKAYYLREAIGAYLDEMEDVYLAEQELRRVKEGKSTTYSLDEVIRTHGLAD
ncbi:type II toxin-antitoxin system RelB family antitoxin [Luteimonas arsenica]|uniref:type II toxin-antitoxin system RelB family antitoxin n=1 Tax=Luteimonas arsenica TaxID=1586242 RepID=UPI0010554FB4|nr:DUF6290 family protein [Luteimonas arsenica]